MNFYLKSRKISHNKSETKKQGKDKSNNSGTHTIVQLQNGVLKCFCKESIFEGIPCKHELTVLIKEGLSENALYFNQRWTKAFYSSEDLEESMNKSQGIISKEEEEENKEEQVISENDLQEENQKKMVQNPSRVKSKGRPNNTRNKHPMENSRGKSVGKSKSKKAKEKSRSRRATSKTTKQPTKKRKKEVLKRSLNELKMPKI